MQLFVNCRFRDITLHQNGWYCDCHILELHQWLQNFTMPNEPKCRSPGRVSGDEIKSLQQNEFSCKPEVSPNSMFLEVVVGKNMSLICNIEVSACLWMNFIFLKIQHSSNSNVISAMVCVSIISKSFLFLVSNSNTNKKGKP